MKRYVLILALVCVAMAGCGKKQAFKQEAQVNSDTLSVKEADTLLATSTNETVQQATTPMASNLIVNSEAESVAETSPSATVSASSSDEVDPKLVQQALKNLGLYNGEIDGKIGRKTKEAIKEFQAKNKLVSDGKVGPKTWGLLKKSLEATSVQAPALVTVPETKQIKK